MGSWRRGCWRLLRGWAGEKVGRWESVQVGKCAGERVKKWADEKRRS